MSEWYADGGWIAVWGLIGAIALNALGMLFGINGDSGGDWFDSDMD